MSRLRAQARRVIGFGLLLPGLLLIHPSGAAAESKPARPSSKRAVPKERTADAKISATARHPDRCVHMVRRGDSLSRIAAQRRVTRQSIVTGNHLANPDTLRVGQRLEIAGCKGAPGRHVATRDPTLVPQDGASLLARVGPRRIPTQLFLAVPDWNGESVEFQWPIDGPIASGFGRRQGGWHAGVDIKAEMGVPIRAAAAGTVLYSGWERYYGRMVKLQHPGGFTSLYAHNLENLVEVGDEVEAGTVIGTVGRSGRASAAHLHFEIRREGMAYNPLHLLETREAPVLASTPDAAVDDDEDRE